MAGGTAGKIANPLAAKLFSRPRTHVPPRPRQKKGLAQ